MIFLKFQIYNYHACNWIFLRKRKSSVKSHSLSEYVDHLYVNNSIELHGWNVRVIERQMWMSYKATNLPKKWESTSKYLNSSTKLLSWESGCIRFELNCYLVHMYEPRSSRFVDSNFFHNQRWMAIDTMNLYIHKMNFIEFISTLSTYYGFNIFSLLVS